ncbi:acyl-CoA synthetase [Aestuariispira insulae]|uniref:3-methylmercaptopropionyl-CoA ligase n=1 Tax=Aestuariispira insulae TaxID=1461337 RepID=A0A3D9HMQ3_9PROT|nr:acyl-CoA synthetase [Aestuariispira insulae]RED50780.1 fatty-acyl-CoA synthase [Aestuariispira insulae]
MTIYENDLGRNSVNHVPLSPLSLIRRTAKVYPNRLAVIHGSLRRTWRETYERCVRLASSLTDLGIGKGDTVAIIAANIPEFLEAHFAIPMCGAVLNSLNTRLDANALSYMLRHGEAKLFLVDSEFSDLAREAVSNLENPPTIIDIQDNEGPARAPFGETDYETLISKGDPNFPWHMPDDEENALALNYTSGTTGNPKGVVYSHRGAYLNAMGNAVTWPMPHFPVYLWTLPMFHCNGWCFPWTITALGGTHVCLRKVDGNNILAAIEEHQVTHFCGAPIVMSMLISAAADQKTRFSQKVSMMTAAAPPPASVMSALEELGIDVTHVYGLTEVYGPAVICSWHPEWDSLPPAERAAKKARQGVPYEVQEDLYVADPKTMEPVPTDGKTIGEIMMRGNIMMKGYLKDKAATETAFSGGWFHTGDLAVMHPDGYVQIMDRSKDIIISGGENISSIEIENVLYDHPDILTAAVVAKPDEKWGETPCAFIELRSGVTIDENEIIAFCRERLAHFKCPRHVIFTEIPKTSTGKIQKYALREKAGSL